MKKKNANGDNSVYFDTARNYWRGSIVIGYDENGKMKRKTVSGKTQSEVKQKLKQIEFGIYSGDYIDKNGITFYALAKQLIDDKYNLNLIKDNTYFTHISTLKRLNPISGQPLQRINESQIRLFLNKELDKSDSILRKDFEMLKKTFEEAVRRKIINENPMDYITIPKSKQSKVKVRALTVDEQIKLLDVLTGEEIKYAAQMLLSLFTGMRMGEVNALTTDDINLTFKKISINKTISRDKSGRAVLGESTKTYAGTRYVRITDDILPLVTGCVDASDGRMLFQDKKGGLLTTNQVNMELARLLKKYKILDETITGKVSCHSLRHTYATRMIEAGVQPKVLQQLLGHTDITVTMNTYCDAFEKFENENLEKAAEYLSNNGLTIEKASQNFDRTIENGKVEVG